jgi:hypothetical protein
MTNSNSKDSSIQVHAAGKILRAILKNEYRPERIAIVWEALVGECEINRTHDSTMLIFNSADIAKHLESIAGEVKA